MVSEPGIESCAGRSGFWAAIVAVVDSPKPPTVSEVSAWPEGVPIEPAWSGCACSRGLATGARNADASGRTVGIGLGAFDPRFGSGEKGSSSSSEYNDSSWSWLYGQLVSLWTDDDEDVGILEACTGCSASAYARACEARNASLAACRCIACKISFRPASLAWGTEVARTFCIICKVWVSVELGMRA